MSTRNMIIMAPAQAAQVLVGIGSVAVFTRLMNPDDFGLYALILSAGMLLHTLVLNWAESAAFRFQPEAAREGMLAAHFATLLKFAAGVVLVSLIGLGAGLLATPVFGWAAAAIGLSFLWSALRFLTKIARETDRVENRMARYAWRETALVAGGFVFAAAALVWTPIGPAAPFLGAVLAGLFIAAFDSADLRKRANGGRFEAPRVQRYAAYGAPLAIGLTVELTMQTATRAVLTATEGAAAAGAYAASSGAIGRALDVLFIWTALAFAPALLRAHEAGLREDVAAASQALARGLLAITAPATIGVCLVAEPLCALLVGPSLAAPASALAPAVALSGFLNGLCVYLATEAYVLSRRTGLRAALLIGAALIHFALLFWLIGIFGLLGAGYAGVISAALALVLLGGFGARLIAWRFPLVDVLKIAAGCMIMAGCVVVLPSPGGVGELLMKSTVGAVIYGAVVVALDMGGLREWMFARMRKAPA